MMDQSVFVCGLCRCRYDETGRRPLLLPCGDVFCEDCVSRLSRPEDIKCPVHQLKFLRKPKELPVCQPLLKSLSPERPAALRCSLHPQKRVKYRCAVHDKFLCTLCIIAHTGAGHHVESFQATSQSARVQSEDLRKLANGRTTSLLDVRKRLEAEERKVKGNYEHQILSINSAYDDIVNALNARRKGHLGALRDALGQQLAVIEAEKNKITRMSEANSHLTARLNKVSLDAPLEDVVRGLSELQRDSTRFEDCDCPTIQLPIFIPSLSYTDNSSLRYSEGSSKTLTSRCRTSSGTSKGIKSRDAGDFSHSAKSASPDEDCGGLEATIPLTEKGAKMLKSCGATVKQSCDCAQGKRAGDTCNGEIPAPKQWTA